MEKKIVINADDFGLCDSVNDAVEKAYVEGVLTSATIMANMPAAEGAVTLAKKLPGLGVGVHLNLVEGLAMSKDDVVGPLVHAQGEFKYSPSRLAALSVIIAKIRRAITAELEAQIQWVTDHDICPTHPDSHQHIHCFPTIFKIACDLAKKFDIKAIR